MRAKFRVKKITRTPSHNGFNEEAELHAVTGGTEEDNNFSEATPAGDLSLLITAEGAKGFFEPGEDYYLDFEKAE